MKRGTFSALSGLVINAATGTLSLGASTPGTCTITYTPPTTSCAVPATTALVVNAPPVPTLAYAASGFCQGAGSAAPTTLTPTGGTFSGATGLIINASTGAVNLTQTPVGTDTISYTSPGTCSATTTTPLTVLPPQAVAFASNGTDFCKAGGPAPTPTAVPAGGTFSGSAGLLLNTSTGAIDLLGTPNGTYTVTYTSARQCPGSATARLTIKGSSPPTYPDVLTPNGDKLNDQLVLKIADVQNYSLRVFNRWGRQVYEGSNAAEGWDPGTNGAGIYYYLVQYNDCASQLHVARNWVEVVK